MYVEVPLFSFEPVRNVEVFYAAVAPGIRQNSLLRVAGAEEYVFLVQGTLKMVTGQEEVFRQEKQHIPRNRAARTGRKEKANRREYQ